MTLVLVSPGEVRSLLLLVTSPRALGIRPLLDVCAQRKREPLAQAKGLNICWEPVCGVGVCSDIWDEDSSSVSVQLCFRHLLLGVM